MILHEAKLPPRKGYIEDQDPVTGERFYRKQYSVVGYSKKKYIITNSQPFEIKKAKNQRFTVTLLAGGSIKSSDIEGLNAEVVSSKLFLMQNSRVQIVIGGPNEPTSFGEHLCAYERSESAKGLTIDGLVYGQGETKDHAATHGICIIEYEEPVYE